MTEQINIKIKKCFDEWKNIDLNIVKPLLDADREMLYKIANYTRSSKIDLAKQVWIDCFDKKYVWKDYDKLIQEELVYYILSLQDSLVLREPGIWLINRK
jgi:hypothetical protein